VARQEEAIRQPAEKAQGRAVLPLVHHASATLHGLEEVPVLEGREGAMHLGVREVMGALEHRDAAAQPPAPAQVPGLPLHFLFQLDEASTAASHDLLSRMGQGALVEVQVSCKVEDPLWCCGDEELQAEVGHGPSLASLVSPCASRGGYGASAMRLSLAFAVVLLVACSSEPPDTVGSEEWKALAPLPGGPRQEIAVVELGGRVYVLGGLDQQGRGVSRVEVYDPLTDSWSSRAPLPQPLHHLNAAAVGSLLYVVGGLGDDFVAAGDTYVYEPGTDTWTEKQGMPAGTERGASGVAVIGSRIYVAGGLRSRSVDEVSAYDTATDTWESLAPIPEPLDHLVGASVSGLFYALGGRRDAPTNRVDAFDPSTRQWSSRAHMPTPRAGCAAGVLGGRIYVLGGEGNPSTSTGVFLENEVYDPATNEWATASPMRTPRHGIGAAAVGDALIIPGGATVQGLGAVDTNESFQLSRMSTPRVRGQTEPVTPSRSM